MEKDKRKKAIETMTNIATNNICEGCGNCDDTPCEYYAGCARLYDMNYRLSAETAEAFAKMFISLWKHHDGSIANISEVISDIKDIAKDFGAEVSDE